MVGPAACHVTAGACSPAMPTTRCGDGTGTGRAAPEIDGDACIGPHAGRAPPLCRWMPASRCTGASCRGEWQPRARFRRYCSHAAISSTLQPGRCLTQANAQCRDPDAAATPRWPKKPPRRHRLRVDAWAAAPGHRRRAACDPNHIGYAAAAATAYRRHLPQLPRRRVPHTLMACRSRRKNRAARRSTMRSAWARHGSSETRCLVLTPAARNTRRMPSGTCGNDRSKRPPTHHAHETAPPRTGSHRYIRLKCPCPAPRQSATDTIADPLTCNGPTCFANS